MIMVPFSQRRHRLHGDEVPEVLKALAMMLKLQVKAEEDLAESTVAFRAFYRLLTHQVGRPNYPEPVTWNVIAEWIHFYWMSISTGWGEVSERA